MSPLKGIISGLPGVVILEPDVHRDDRGFFLESYRRDELAVFGIDDEFVQDNHSRSNRGVVRGIHYQNLSAPMAKLVRCSAGRMLDVAVDLRAGAPTFGRWEAVELSAHNFRQLYVPVGFGHAFLALDDGTEIQYKCSGYYAPQAEGAVRWNDPEIGIDWPIRDPVVSVRDSAAPSLAEYARDPAFRL